MEIKELLVNKNTIIASVFLAGAAIGAFASEVAESGLYLFKPGDPIMASEVNANFDVLLQKISALEAKLASFESDHTLEPVVGSWSCLSDEGNSGFLVFEENGRFSESGVDVFNGIAAAWSHASGDIYIITGNGTNQVTITFSNENQSMRLVPDLSFKDKVTCTRT